MLVMNGQESSSGFFGEEEENASSFAENLKARMMSHQVLTVLRYIRAVGKYCGMLY